MMGFSRYYNNGTGLITVAGAGGNGTVAFNTAQTTSSYITASGVNNTTFTINNTGPCTITAGARFKTDAAVAASDFDWYFRATRVSGALEIGAGALEKVPRAYAINTFFIINISVTRYMTAGDQIQFQLANNTNQGCTFVNSGETIFCSFQQEGF